MRDTELLYLHDSYLNRFSARIVETGDHSVVLDRTAFYPRGGGQMADRGVLKTDDGPYPVIAVERRGTLVHHTVESSLPRLGARAEGILDWDFRYQMMRTHTALHILCGVIYRQYSAVVTGCQMYSSRARMDFSLHDLNAPRVREIEALSNEAVLEGRPVRVRFVPRREAELMPDLIRTKINLVPAHVDPVRVVDIVGLDIQADGGTHVANTLEVGAIRVIRTENKGRENRRIEIELAPLPNA